MANKYRLKDYLKKTPVIFYSILRIAAGVLILFNPILGFFITLFLDALDGPLFEQLENFVDMPRSIYTRWDKYLDWWGYMFMYIVSFQFGFSWILTISILFRLIGQLIFEKIQKHYIFTIFPNFFEAFFLWYVIFPLLDINLNFFWLILILVVYELREVALHIYWSNRLKKYGYPKWQIKYFGVRKEVLE